MRILRSTGFQVGLHRYSPCSTRWSFLRMWNKLYPKTTNSETSNTSSSTSLAQDITFSSYWRITQCVKISNTSKYLHNYFHSIYSGIRSVVNKQRRQKAQKSQTRQQTQSICNYSVSARQERMHIAQNLKLLLQWINSHLKTRLAERPRKISGEKN